MIPERSERVFKKIEVQRQQIGWKLSLCEDEILTWRPDSRKWNILEVLQHLVLSEKLSLAYLKKKWSFSPQLSDKSIITDLKGWFLVNSMRSPIPLKAPKGVSVFDENLSLLQILNNWEHIRIGMYDFLKDLDEDVFEKIFYKHPSVGKVTLNHMLLFFHQHIKRHTSQIENILKQRNQTI